jgi:hypothetical protein
MPTFNIGDKIEYNGQIHEVVSWPGEGEFFVQLVQHRPDGASSSTMPHIANMTDVKLVTAAPVVDYTTPVEPPAAAIEPVSPASVEAAE